MKHYQAHETQRMEELNGIELASFVSRAGALMIDSVISATLFIGIMAPVASAMKKLGIVEPDLKITLSFYDNWYSIVWYVLYFGLSFYFGNGKTIGKWICRIRVVSLVHGRMDFWHSVERALGYGASILEGGFGFVQYFIHPNCRTVHDRIAETIVVRERKKILTADDAD